MTVLEKIQPKRAERELIGARVEQRVGPAKSDVKTILFKRFFSGNFQMDCGSSFQGWFNLI